MYLYVPPELPRWALLGFGCAKRLHAPESFSFRRFQSLHQQRLTLPSGKGFSGSSGSEPSGDLCKKYILFEVGSFQPAGCFPLLLCLRTSLLLFLTAVFIEGFGERSCSHDEQMCFDGSEPLLQSGAPRQPTSVIAPSSLLLFFLRNRFHWPASLSSVP